MDTRILHIAAYDIRNARRLRLALHAVKGYATGGQKSVFECFLTAGERNNLLSEIEQAVDVQEDAFVLIRLDPRSRVIALGLGVEPDDPPFYYLG